MIQAFYSMDHPNKSGKKHAKMNVLRFTDYILWICYHLLLRNLSDLLRYHTASRSKALSAFKAPQPPLGPVETRISQWIYKFKLSAILPHEFQQNHIKRSKSRKNKKTKRSREASSNLTRFDFQLRNHPVWSMSQCVLGTDVLTHPRWPTQRPAQLQSHWRPLTCGDDTQLWHEAAPLVQHTPEYCESLTSG